MVDLLIPRYEVLEDCYPYIIGQVIHSHSGVLNPLIFRPMYWWEGRDLGELPDFVRIETRLRGVEIRPIKWCIMPHFRYGISYNIEGFWFDIPDNGGLFIPATEKEYLDFKSRI